MGAEATNGMLSCLKGKVLNFAPKATRFLNGFERMVSD
jgi:hypothetical protein